MHYWKRPEEPAELAAQRAAYTDAWKQERDAREAARAAGQRRREKDFKWPTVKDEAGNKETLQERFYRITDNHCAYCDNTVQPASNMTIDHFKEKTGNEDEAYVWENLYACCGGCQSRGAWDADLLRPDADDYSFLRYFRYTHDGWLKVACAEGTEEHRKATKTEAVLRLNRPKLRQDREDEFGRDSKQRRYPPPKPCDQATAARIMARREEQRQDVTRRPYRDWYLELHGTVCRCCGCEERRQ